MSQVPQAAAVNRADNFDADGQQIDAPASGPTATCSRPRPSPPTHPIEALRRCRRASCTQVRTFQTHSIHAVGSNRARLFVNAPVDLSDA